MPYSVKPLGCDPARVKGMSERLIVSHYENNYGGAVKRLNLIEEKLAELDYANAPGFTINGLKREELIAMNSMILHELFFDGLGDESEPGLALKNAIAHDFGSYERWRSEFVAMGKALGGGSGWVLLSWSARDHKLVNQWAADHCHTLAGGTPILALDMYEHSYHIDFGAKAGGYVDTFMGAGEMPTGCLARRPETSAHEARRMAEENGNTCRQRKGLPNMNDALAERSETLMMKRKIVVVIATLGFLASWVNSDAAEKFQKLSGPQMRAKFTGMEMTDHVHFADVFGSNGNLKTYSMGHKKYGKWRVDRDELCVDRGKDDGGCYQVWISGKNVEFRREGLQATSEGILQRPVARN